MALQDWLESDVAVAVAATTVVLSPKARRLMRRGAVYAVAGALKATDRATAAAREVARQAGDVVLVDDDFSTLVEVLVEGRGFWHNMRRALALLLGGNLGELGLMVGASALGLAAPLTPRQILAVNLVSDVLPAVSVAVQEPEHRNLSRLSREGTTALDAPLRAEILRRGAATTVPSLAAFVLASRSSLQPQTVAFASIVSTPLAQTSRSARRWRQRLGRRRGRRDGDAVGAGRDTPAGARVLRAPRSVAGRGRSHRRRVGRGSGAGQNARTLSWA